MSEPWIWTEERKEWALSNGYVCCEYYFVCWHDPPPYERGACCHHMKDKTWTKEGWVEALCGGCQRLKDERAEMEKFIERKLEEKIFLTALDPWIPLHKQLELRFGEKTQHV